MNDLVKVVVFSLISIGLFSVYASFGIPQIKPAPPPVEEELDLGAMTMEQFIALGDQIYNGKGACTLCHNEMLRAPMLDKMGAVSAKRMADPGYMGAARTVEEYLYESLVEPSAYVVPGFGKAGTNDTESPMPDVSAGGIGLSDAEIRAVIAYLQQLDGGEVTVSVPGQILADKRDNGAEGADRTPLATPEAIVAEFACGTCHKVAGESGDLGPDLTHLGALRDKDHIRRSLLDPNAEITEGFMPGIMPDSYGEQMSARELELLVNYLAGLK